MQSYIDCKFSIAEWLIFCMLISIMSINGEFVETFCPNKWRFGINFYDDYDSIDFPVLNKSWSNSSSFLSEAPTIILASSLNQRCLKNSTYSPIKWCRENIYSIYRKLLGVQMSDHLFNQVVCYHLCLNIVNSELFQKNSTLQVCPSPCHQSDICTRLDSSTVECIPTRTVIFSHDFDCSCKPKFYWDSHRQRCARLNPCETQKYYPCYRPGTAWCVFDQKEFTFECQCNIDYVGYRCSDRYNPCRHVSHKHHPITIRYPGDRVCNVNNGNSCISQNYTYKCECSSSWRADSRFPYDNCLLQITQCLAMICVKGQCLSSRNGKKGFCKCNKDWGGTNCNEFVGTWTDWSRWDRCRPNCGNNRWTVRTRTCHTDISSTRKDCDGSALLLKQCPNRLCAHEVENLVVKIFEIRYALFFSCILANLIVGLVSVLIWKFLFFGIIRYQVVLFLQIIREFFGEVHVPDED